MNGKKEDESNEIFVRYTWCGTKGVYGASLARQIAAESGAKMAAYVV